MGRTRESANLVSDKNIFVDIANDFVGIGTTAPTVALEVSGNAKVSGIVTATTFSGGLSGGTVSATTGAFSGDVTLTDTDTGSSAGPELKLYRNSSSPADSDYLGQIKFAGESDTGAERNYAKITGKISDASNNTEDGIIEIAHIKAGSQNISARWTSTELHLLNGTELSLDDSQKIYIGTGDDLQIYHDGSASYIAADDLRVTNGAVSETLAKFVNGGAVELYHNDSKKFETGQYGATVTGSLAASNIELEDDGKLLIGTSDDLQIYHDSNNSLIKHVGTGDLYIQADNGDTLYLRPRNNEDGVKIINDGAVELYYNNAKKFETSGGGVTVTGVATATSFSGDGSNLTNVPAGFSAINFVLS